MAFKKGDWSLEVWTKLYGFNEPWDGSLKNQICLHAHWWKRRPKTLDMSLWLHPCYRGFSWLKEVLCLARVSWHILTHKGSQRPLFISSCIFWHTQKVKILYIYIYIWVCVVKKRKLSHLWWALPFFFYKYWILLCMYKSVQLYTYPQFEHECSLCWNELKPVHSHNMILVNHYFFFLEHSNFSQCLHVNISTTGFAQTQLRWVGLFLFMRI